MLEVVEIISISIGPAEVALPAGSRRHLTARCELSSGAKESNIALLWREEDPSIAQVSASGMVYGFREGATEVTAHDDAVASQDAVTVVVGPSEDRGGGSGYPRVLISEINQDPDTDETVVLSADDPPVHQRPHDVERNIWWINSASPLARLYLDQFGPESREWRIYHLERYIDVIVQIATAQGPDAEDELDADGWTARWGERAADIQAAAATGLAAFIEEGDLPA